jgi:hypothetical protein
MANPKSPPHETLRKPRSRTRPWCRHRPSEAAGAVFTGSRALQSLYYRRSICCNYHFYRGSIRCNYHFL